MDGALAKVRCQLGLPKMRRGVSSVWDSRFRVAQMCFLTMAWMQLTSHWSLVQTGYLPCPSGLLVVGGSAPLLWSQVPFFGLTGLIDGDGQRTSCRIAGLHVLTTRCNLRYIALRPPLQWFVFRRTYNAPLLVIFTTHRYWLYVG